MPIFLVVSLKDDTTDLDQSVRENFRQSDNEQSNYHQLQGNAGWLIDFKGTTQELSNKLGITGQAEGEKPKIGSAMVVPVSNYWGRGPGDMWEWLKLKME